MSITMTGLHNIARATIERQVLENADCLLCDLYDESGIWHQVSIFCEHGALSEIVPVEYAAKVTAQRDALLAALRLAQAAIDSCTPGDTSTGHVIAPYYDEELCGTAEKAIQAAFAAAEAP